jgi:chromosome segregation ATPase
MAELLADKEQLQERWAEVKKKENELKTQENLSQDVIKLAREKLNEVVEENLKLKAQISKMTEADRRLSSARAANRVAAKGRARNLSSASCPTAPIKAARFQPTKKRQESITARYLIY